jgi:hypothetical protein
VLLILPDKESPLLHANSFTPASLEHGTEWKSGLRNSFSEPLLGEIFSAGPSCVIELCKTAIA